MTVANLSVAPNDHDDVTISANVTFADGYEAENTQNFDRGDVLRTSDLTTLILTCVAPETRIATSVFAFRHLLNGASMRWQFFTDTGATSTSSGGDSGTFSVPTYTASESYLYRGVTNDPYASESAAFYHYAAPVSYRSYKVTVSGTPNAASYYEIGRLAVCNMFEAAINPDYGAQLGLKDQTKSNRTDGATYRPTQGESYRTLTVDLNNIDESERTFWMNLMRRNGTAKDVIVSVFRGDGTTLERDYTFDGIFSALDPIGRQVSRLTKRLQMEEV